MNYHLIHFNVFWWRETFPLVNKFQRTTLQLVCQSFDSSIMLGQSLLPELNSDDGFGLDDKIVDIRKSESLKSWEWFGSRSWFMKTLLTIFENFKILYLWNWVKWYVMNIMVMSLWFGKRTKRSSRFLWCS